MWWAWVLAGAGLAGWFIVALPLAIVVGKSLKASGWGCEECATLYDEGWGHECPRHRR